MAKKPEKTNVMRLLTGAGIPFTPHYYAHEEGVAVDGATVAAITGQPPEKVFKTLVTRGGKKNFYVFVIPVEKELSLKAAAKAAGEKSVEMLHVNELLPLTGYIRGGCSPVGMKKLFPTFIDASALAQPTIMVSGGKIGTQVELEPQALAQLVGAQFADIAGEPS
jgi:Cys-tRNA(Pro)/Cys-tRNA(Cys) deacylase